MAVRDGAVDGVELAFADLPGQLGLQRRVGATGAATQAVVVELDDVGEALDDPPHRQVRFLHVAQVTGILHDHAGVRAR